MAALQLYGKLMFHFMRGRNCCFLSFAEKLPMPMGLIIILFISFTFFRISNDFFFSFFKMLFLLR